MEKSEAINKAVEKRKEKNEEDFQCRVEDLIWEISETSDRLRKLKKELAELKIKETPIPDLSDCL